MYTLSMSDEVRLQMSFILSDDNKWYAKKHYIKHHGYDKDRILTNDELALYWVECGAAKWFRDVYLKQLSLIMSDDNVWFAKAYYVKHHGYDKDRILTIDELLAYWGICGAAKWFMEAYIERCQKIQQNQRSA